MKDFPTKANISAGDDSGSAVKFGAHEFNSLADENENAVTSTGQTLTTGQAADTETEQLARALVIAGQSASSYVDSGAVNAYVLTGTVSTLVQPENYFDGMKISFIPSNDNTGASTINVSGIGAKSIRTVLDATIPAGTLSSTSRYDFVYNSSFASGSGAFVITDFAATDAETITGTVINKYTTPASVQAKGASGAETITAAIDTKFVTPLGLSSRVASQTQAGLIEIATDAEIATGTDPDRTLSVLGYTTASAGAWQTITMLNGNTSDYAEYRTLNNGKNVQIRIIDLDVSAQTATTIGLLSGASYLPEHTSTFTTAESTGATCIIRISSAGSIISYTTNAGKYDFNITMAVS